MASIKRDNPYTDQGEPLPKRSKNAADESFHSQGTLRVVLNPADCNLDFNIERDGLMGHSLYENGFAYCWSGARANIGITGGKYCFGCKIVSCQPVEMEDTPLDQRHVCRVGISRGDDPVGNLGESDHSYGFGGTGKFSNAGRFVDYGERFGIGDTIVCLLDLESKPCGAIKFLKNGKRLGVAKHLDAVDPLAQKSALFPHVLLKNTVIEMQFSVEDGLVPEDGYKPWASAVIHGKAVIGPCFSDPRDCEVLMMVGLPACGKTTWAEKWVKEHPEKRYVLLGTNLVLDQMKVPGLLRKNNYSERFDRLMDRATCIFNTLLSRAAKVPRNYIIDQTNVYKSARIRKLKSFAMYRKIAVVVFPRPEELKLRTEKRFKEMGKQVPPEAVNEMLANFVLPMSKDMRGANEYFDQVMFPELDRTEAQWHLDEMKRALAMGSGGESKSLRSPYSQGSSVLSDSSVSAYTSSKHNYSLNSLQSRLHSDSRQAYSGYSCLSSGVRGVSPGGSWVDPAMPDMHPYPANVDGGYVVSSFVGRAEPRDPYRNYANSMPSRDGYGRYSNYNSSLARDDLTRYGGYAYYDPLRRQDLNHPIGTHVERSFLGDAREAYRPLSGLPYGAPNARPHSHESLPGYGWQPGNSPYDGGPPRYY